MRLRNIPGSAEAVNASPYVIQDPAALRGHWREYFGCEGPVHLEIGMGKGQFLREMAAENPNICFIGIERYTSVLLKAVERTTYSALPAAEAAGKAAPAQLLRYICADARQVTYFFAPGEVDRIYLNFPDPWPKARHSARRLTSPGYLRLYAQIISGNGTLEFKTDNRDFFDFSLRSALDEGWEILAQTADLHHDTLGEGNVMTEYEEKFSAAGKAVCKLILQPGKSQLKNIQQEESKMTQIITESEFEEKVLKAEGPVLVDFYADWCGPCKMMAPILDELSEEKAGQLTVYKINIDENRDLADKYNIMSIPNMNLFKDGQIVVNVIGSMTKAELLEKLEPALA